MTLYVGDRGPKTVPFSIPMPVDSDGEVEIDGNTVASVRFKILRPTSVEVEVATGVLVTSEAEVAFLWLLQSDGTSLPVAGPYYGRMWLYDSGGELLLDTDEILLFTVKESRFTWPT